MTFHTATMDSTRLGGGPTNTRTETRQPPSPPTTSSFSTGSSLLLCSAQTRRESEEEEPNDSYSFMGCLAPSTGSTSTSTALDHDEETILSSKTTSDTMIPYLAASSTTGSSATCTGTTSKVLDGSDNESPKCAAASLTGLTADLTLGADDDEQVQMYPQDNNSLTRFTNNVIVQQETSYPADTNDDNSMGATSVGLMASGLAWVRRQQQNRYGPASPSRDHAARYAASLQGPVTEVTSRDSAPPCTPVRPNMGGASHRRHALVEAQSCPTSPSLFMSNSSQLFSLAKLPLASNSSINNTQTTSRSVASSPLRTQLAPRLNQVNNIYSISTLLTGHRPNSDSHDSQESSSFHQHQHHQVAYPVVRTGTIKDAASVSMVVDDNYSKTVPAPPSLGYFCQDDNSKSPTRSALARVFSRIGSEYTDEEDLTSDNNDGDDDDDSLLDNNNDDNGDEEDIHGVAWIPRVRTVAESPARVDSCIFSPMQMHQVARHVLPKGIASCQWKRVYSLARDGDSFDVCLHHARNDTRTLMVVRTTRGAVFGAYAGETWSRNGEAHYYGNSESCLFSFEQQKPKVLATSEEDSIEGEANESSNTSTDEQDRASSPTSFLSAPKEVLTPQRPQTMVDPLTPMSPTPMSPPLVQRPDRSLVDDDFDEDDEDNYETSLPPIRVYKYKGVNRYIQYCDASRRMLAFGGGGDEGSFGLCVEREFQVGSTGHCDTFDNEPLCEQENFKIVDVELWGFLTGKF